MLNPGMLDFPINRRKLLSRKINSLSGLLGYYKMDEKTGLVVANSALATPNQFNGTRHTVVTLDSVVPTSKIGHGYLFDGASGFVDGLGFTLFNQSNKKMTVGMFVYCANWTTGGGRIYSEGRASSITPQNQLFNTANTLSYNSRSDGSVTMANKSSAANVLINGKLQLICLSDDNGVVKAYVDGVEVFGGYSYTRAGTTLDRIGFGALVRNTNSAFFGGYIQHAFCMNSIIAPADVLKIAKIAKVA